MIKAIAAPRITNKRLAFIPYVYAFALAAVIVWQLFVMQQYLSYISDLLGETPGWMPTTVAAVLIGFEIFSLPFLLQAKLSPLARLCSAAFAFLTPVAWAIITMFNDNFGVGLLFIDVGCIIWGAISFWVLDGPKLFGMKDK